MAARRNTAPRWLCVELVGGPFDGEFEDVPDSADSITIPGLHGNHDYEIDVDAKKATYVQEPTEPAA